MDLSSWVLSRILPDDALAFTNLCHELAVSTQTSIALAQMNDFLVRLSRRNFTVATRNFDAPALTALSANLVAAMVEQTAANLGLRAPDWVKRVKPLCTPYFATEIVALRLYLLANAPVLYRRRNLFLDSTIGARV